MKTRTRQPSTDLQMERKRGVCVRTTRKAAHQRRNKNMNLARPQDKTPFTGCPPQTPSIHLGGGAEWSAKPVPKEGRNRDKERERERKRETLLDAIEVQLKWSAKTRSITFKTK